MDERSRQAHATQQQAQQFGAPAQPASPWPDAAHPHPAGTRISGHAPHHAPMQPTHGQTYDPHAAAIAQQFQFAGGYVMPGAAAGQAPPMSAHDGTIGTPHVGHPQYGMPMQAAPPGYAHAHPLAQQAQHPHAWAYPTPEGLQLVQPGATPSWAQQHAMAAPGMNRRPRRRIRWETIIPALAIACLVAAGTVFFKDFDRMTGRGAAPTSPAKERSADPATSGTESTAGEVDEVVAQAQGLFAKGQFDDAANLLHPLLDVASPAAAAVALHDRVDAASERNKSLLGRLARERSAGDWSAVIATVGQLQQLRPLSPKLVEMRRDARDAIKARASIRTAKSLMAQGRLTAASDVIDTALAKGRNGQLEALREQVSAMRARPATRPSNGGPTAPPGAGSGSGSNAPTSRPPANVPQGSMPPRPDLPNPTGGQGTGAGAVGGGAAAAGDSNCHTHGGVTECH